MRPRTYWLIILALLTTLTGQCTGTEHAAAAASPAVLEATLEGSRWWA
ncbi:MAG: hypothetical protein ACRDZO_23120 [Egibacteraceae bacterium]